MSSASADVPKCAAGRRAHEWLSVRTAALAPGGAIHACDHCGLVRTTSGHTRSYYRRGYADRER